MKERLLVAIVGAGADPEKWATLLRDRGVPVVREPAVGPLTAGDPDMALIFAEPAAAASVASEIAAQPHAPPVLLLIGEKDQEHPHTRVFEALVSAKRDWEGTFDAIVDPVALVDSSGVVVRANLGFASAAGRPIAEIVGLVYGDIVGEPLEGAEDPVAISLADGQARTSEVRFSRLPGLQQVTTSPLPKGASGLPGLVVILKDVTGAKDHQERMLQAVRLSDVGQLAAGVAHEINTPLASIALRAESLLKAADDPLLQSVDSFKNFKRYLKTIQDEVFRCKRIMTALMDFARARKPEIRRTEINALVERAADLVAHQMRLQQVTLELRLDPALPAVQADDGQLRQVLLALLMNAMDATAAGGEVRVETLLAEGEIVLAVTDSGVGIPPENMDKIFNPFFTTKPLGKGTGLGLPVCHGIVTSHGGRIHAESEPGKGTRVVVSLPLGGPVTPAASS